MATWTCIQGCGACCHLDLAERSDVQEYLSAEEFERYLSLIGTDGWCIHFDHAERKCRIYAERPGFCRVTPETFQRLYGIEPEALNEFAISCCREQIDAVYGSRSLEGIKFDGAVGLDFS